MKKFLLYFTLILCALNANAQVTLNNSPYTENFDNIGSGLPNGFFIQTGSSQNTPGNDGSFSSAATSWSNSTGGFYNCASASGLRNTSTPNEQALSTNRALSIRQTASYGNPGGAFVFKISSTENKTGFVLNFRMVSLDSTDEGVTAWTVDYGLGATPTTFTVIPTIPVNIRTGGKPGTDFYRFFTDVSVNFGTALDNKSDVIWIRVWAPISTTITTPPSIPGLPSTNNNGIPTMSGIDDWNLTWTNNPNTSAATVYKNSENILISGFIGNDIRLQTKNAFSGTTTVRLTNLNGAVLWERQYLRLQANQTEWVRPGQLSKGIYILQIQNASERITKRLAN